MLFRARMFAILSIIVLSSCSHPMMKLDEEPAPAGLKPSPTLAPTPKKLEESQRDQELFETDQIRWVASPDQWDLISDEKGIQAYQRRDGTIGAERVSFRGETIIPAPLVKIATILNNENIQKEWVDSLAEARTIEKKSNFRSIGYNRTQVPWPFRDRDFLYSVQVKVNVEPPTMLIEMRSTQDSRMPPVEGVVRGEIVLSYFYMKQLPGSQGTKMVIEMTVDPKGAIPLWLVRSAQKRWPSNTLTKLKELSMKESIPVSPEILNYFETRKTNGGK
jgi:hypothetical protein